MRRWARGVASLAVLLGLTVGVPMLLVVLGGNPLPRDRSLAALGRALLRPDDGSLLIGLVTVLGWAAWLVFAVSVLAELINLVSRRRAPVRLPGLGGVQRWTAGLMLAVLALLVVSASAPSPAPSAPAPAQVTPDREGSPFRRTPVEEAPTESSRRQARPAQLSAPDPATRALTGRPVSAPGTAVSASGSSGRADHVHTVRGGDDLWSLAERYYGQGRDWRRIAHANRGLLTGGPDRLRIGWRLVIPDVGPGSADDAPRVRVRPSDTLTAIARRELGSGQRWSELFRANRDQLGDPDEVPVGISLELPDRGERSGRAEPSERPPGEQRQDRPESPEQDAPPEPGPREKPQERQPRDHRPHHELEPGVAPESADTSPSHPSAASPGPPTVPGKVTSERAEPDVPATVPTPVGPSADAPVQPERTGLAADPAVPLGLSAVGGLLAAGLVATLARRRRVQLWARPPGRRIAHPPAPVRPAEVVLGRRARPLSLRTLDRAMRAIAAHYASTGTPLPVLQLAYVSDRELELVLAEPASDAPVCFTVDGRRWRLTQADAGYLSSVPGLSDAVRPWPGLVSLGTDAEGRQVLADLEGLGLLAVSGPAGAVRSVLAAVTVELSCAPWNEELSLTLVGENAGLPDALGLHQVTRCDDVDALLDRLERRAQEQRTHAAEPASGSPRLDLDRAEAWAPEIVVATTVWEPPQRQRLTALIRQHPRVTVAAVVCGAPDDGWTLDLDDRGCATLRPDSRVDATGPDLALTLVLQQLPPPAVDAVVELMTATGSLTTTPAPWWGPDRARSGPPAGGTSAPDPLDRPPDNVTYLGRRFTRADGEEEGRAEVQRRMTELAVQASAHPTLGLLGPLQLLGAAGPPPPRAAKQCLEYCAWLLDHPGATAQAMRSALFVAEGTRRSNMSRLRSWLGSDVDGRPYLPDAYSGHIRLDPCVSSDWQQLQVLTVAGVNRASSVGLELALELVRGAPLADAAPGQWCWAEELRTDMISCVRDVGVELAGRALAAGDVDLARWAAARALVAAPGDELLLAMRVRTEHRAGNVAETERLSRELAQQSRLLGVDLDPSTVTLLQEVLEGRMRARMA